MLADFFAGASYLVKGFHLIRQPSLRRFVIAPILINIIVFSALVYFGWAQFGGLVDAYLPESQGWWSSLLHNLLSIVFWSLALMALYFGFTVLANLIAAPFNGLLAERVQAHLGNEKSKQGGFAEAIRDVASAVKSELHKYLYFSLIAIIVAVTIIVPVVNLLSAVLAVVASAWIMGLEYIAYPAENMGCSFRATRAAARKHRMLNLGFGTAILVAVLIPLANLLVMPAAVAGATALWIDRFRAES